MSRNTVARIDLSALSHNLAQVRALAQGSEVAAVVKADAYGHGIATISRMLESPDLLAVATVGEAQVVRESGWGGRVLLLEGFSGTEEYDQAQALETEVVIHQQAQLDLLEQRRHGNAPITWLKLDTGMHRLGFPASDAVPLQERLSALNAGRPPVLMSHFACADDPGNEMTGQQIRRFDRAVSGLPGQQSLSNSAGVLNYSEASRDIVRPGIMLYGISPVAGTTGRDHGLREVMSLQCELLAINECAAGESVGYGARYRCPENMRIGVAGIGYGDGYPRDMPDGAPVLINGRRAILAGTVSMDMITIDLRGHEAAAVGDTVTLWGEGLPVEEVANALGTIPYALVCGVTGRVRRLQA